MIFFIYQFLIFLDIYDYIVKDFFSKTENEKAEYEKFNLFIDAFYLLFKNQINLITDDSFKVTLDSCNF